MIFRRFVAVALMAGVSGMGTIRGWALPNAVPNLNGTAWAGTARVTKLNTDGSSKRRKKGVADLRLTFAQTNQLLTVTFSADNVSDNQGNFELRGIIGNGHWAALREFDGTNGFFNTALSGRLNKRATRMKGQGIMVRNATDHVVEFQFKAERQ